MMDTLSRICFSNTGLQLVVSLTLHFEDFLPVFSPFYWYKTTKVSSSKASDSFPPNRAISLFPMNFFKISKSFLPGTLPRAVVIIYIYVLFPIHNSMLLPNSVLAHCKRPYYLCWTFTNPKIASTIPISVFIL